VKTPIPRRRVPGERNRHVTSRIDLDQGSGDHHRAAGIANPTVYVADPGPLGSRPSGTTFVLSVFNTNMANESGSAVVIGLALSTAASGSCCRHVGVPQEQHVGALAFDVVWRVLVVLRLSHPVHDLTKATDANQALGVFVLMWAIFTRVQDGRRLPGVPEGRRRVRAADVDLRRARHPATST